MPDIPTTPQTSTIADTAAGAVDTAAGTAQATAGAAVTPPPEPPSPPPAPAVEAAPAPAPAPAPKPAEVVADVASAPAPKPAEAVAAVAVAHASTPAASPTPKVADTIDQVTATPAVKTVTEQATATVNHVTSSHVAATASAKSVTDTVTQATDPVVHGTAGTVTQAIADPVVNGTTSAVSQAIEPVVNATTTTVTQATDPVVSGVGAATGGAGSTVTKVTDTVTSTAGQATAPVRPVVDTVASTTGAAAAPVRPVVDTVASTAGQAAAPVRPLVDTVATTSGAAVAPVRPVVDTVAAVPSAATHAAEPLVSGQGSPSATRLADAITGPASQAAHQAVASTAGGGPSVSDVAPHVGSGPRGGLTDTLAAVGDPGALNAPPAPDPTTASLLAHATPASAPGGAAHSAAADTFAQVATDPRLLAVTGVTALAGTAYIAARAAGCVAGGDQSVILTNVRLIPCLVKSGMASSTTALAGVRAAAGSASSATRAEIHLLGEHVSGAAGKARQDLDDHVVAPFRDGIARATGDPRGGDSSGSDLFFLGIGMVVGLLYAAILSLWMFLVRPRWSTRA